ncbi:glycosyltransferase family 9 protein [Pseudodesulfovibrio sp. zrk46]|uniref:glycosyltransferase family 9 protein n=1 Tax=Pseudodesulfovibrio sp. zrk46 TaxID=2725288 RepID=UPI001FFC3A72|nr:glycosyltransferase family 9 protein [Pseudodesulfovibrio sp. zrk46]
MAQLIYPNVTVHSIACHGTGLTGPEAMCTMLVDNVSAFSQLTSLNFETIFNLNFSPLNFRIAALFEPERVKGYSWKNGQELVGIWPSMAMRWSDYRRIGINLVDFWAGYCPDMISPQKVNPIASPKGGGIGVVLAGRESRRSLPVNTLAQVVSTFARSQQAERITLLGGGAEEGAGKAVIKSLPSALQKTTSNMAGKTQWTDLVDIVGSLDMLVTPDTGTMHLAAHLGTPVRAFFLSSAWCFETGPYGTGHLVYQASTDCLPCLETAPCIYDVKCGNSFNSQEFQRFLVTHKPEHCPTNLTLFTSEFDTLGQVYTPVAGNDPDAEQRIKFRSFIEQFLTGKGEASDMETVFAQRLYRENDWIMDSEPGKSIGL